MNEPSLLDLVDRLSNLVDAYEALSLLSGAAGDIGADRVSRLLEPVNNDLFEVLRGLENLLKKGGSLFT